MLRKLINFKEFEEGSFWSEVSNAIVTVKGGGSRTGTWKAVASGFTLHAD